MVNYLAHGLSVDEFLDDYPNLTQEAFETAIAPHTAESGGAEVRAF
jgi:uncharacterized protein (DUF433 family)